VQIYERNIHSSVRIIDKKHLVTEASLLDLNHAMHISLTINRQTHIIEKARAQILKAPLKICDSTTDLMKRIEGLKLERGINKRLVQALSQTDGCTHLYELTLTAIRLTFNTIIGLNFGWDEWVSKSIPDDEFIRIASPFLKNSCRPFQDDDDKELTRNK
jgi:hypothetical protein